MDLENLSRRTFIKRTTVLTVGISTATLFSGLVDAAVLEYGKKPSSTCKDADTKGYPAKFWYFYPTRGGKAHCYKEYKCPTASGGFAYCQEVFTAPANRKGKWHYECDYDTVTGKNKCEGMGIKKKTPGLPWPP